MQHLCGCGCHPHPQAIIHQGNIENSENIENTENTEIVENVENIEIVILPTIAQKVILFVYFRSLFPIARKKRGRQTGTVDYKVLKHRC